MLVDDNITLDGELTCTADVSLRQGVVSGSCAGADIDGKAITSTLDGTVSISAPRCAGDFIVTWDGDIIENEETYDCDF